MSVTHSLRQTVLVLTLLSLTPATAAGEMEYSALALEGKRLFDAKDYAGAVAISRKAVDEAMRSFGPEHAKTLFILDKYALALSANQQYDESNRVYQHVLSLNEKRRDAEGSSTIINNISGNFTRQGRYAEAIEWTRKALAMRETVLGPNHPKVAELKNYLALDLKRIGRFSEAEALLRNVLSIWERSADPNLVYALSNLANLLSQLGRYGEAEPLFQRALRTAEKNSGGESGLAMLQGNYAAALGELGRHSDAEALLRRSLDQRERTLGPQHFGTAQTLRNLAASVSGQGKSADAEALLRRALGIFEATQGPEHHDTVKAVHGLAVVLADQGKHGEAEPFAKRAVHATEKLLGLRHPETADRRRAYARSLLARGERTQALAQYLDAFNALKRAGQPRPLLKAAADIATVLHGSGLLEQALPYYREAIDTLDMLFAQTRGLDEQTRYSFLSQYAYVYRNMLQLLLDLHRRHPQARHDHEIVAVASRNQSRIFSELLRRADIGVLTKDTAFLALRDERQALGDQIASLRQELAVLSPTELNAAIKASHLERNTTELAKRLASIEDTLRMRHPKYMEIEQPRQVTVAELQNRLIRPGEALLSFVLLGDEVVILALTRERLMVTASPASREDIVRRITRVRTPIHEFTASGSIEALAGLDPNDLHGLFKILIAPVAAMINGASRLLVVGDGPLNTIPFEMLLPRFDDETRKRFAQMRKAADGSPAKPLLSEYGTLAYFGNEANIAYLPSIVSLAVQRSDTRLPSSYSRELVSFADPVFDGEPGADVSVATRAVLSKLAAGRTLRSKGTSLLARLPETADEARQIAQALGGETEVFLRNKAQESTLKALDLKGVRYLHFATHGLLGGEFLLVRDSIGNSVTPLTSTQGTRNLTVSAPPKLQPPEIAKANAGEPAIALTVSGVTGGEDGLLTMSEVMSSLNLDAQLVVLSACNTAGETDGGAGGEGFAGLTRAFMFAGAQGLVVSHWPVESVSTQELMAETFRQIKAGHLPGPALQKGRLHILKSRNRGGKTEYSREHPFFWAPFVYVGT